jgi:hypothetical protein
MIPLSLRTLLATNISGPVMPNAGVTPFVEDGMTTLRDEDSASAIWMS